MIRRGRAWRTRGSGGPRRGSAGAGRSRDRLDIRRIRETLPPRIMDMDRLLSAQRQRWPPVRGIPAKRRGPGRRERPGPDQRQLRSALLGGRLLGRLGRSLLGGLLRRRSWPEPSWRSSSPAALAGASSWPAVPLGRCLLGAAGLLRRRLLGGRLLGRWPSWPVLFLADVLAAAFADWPSWPKPSWPRLPRRGLLGPAGRAAPAAQADARLLQHVVHEAVRPAGVLGDLADALPTGVPLGVLGGERRPLGPADP